MAEPDLGSVVARLPTSVDLALAVDNGAALRRELGGMPLMLTLATQPRPEAVFEAWSELAGELGMTDAEAFDLLLGRRMIIAGADLQYGDAGDPQWALLSEIDPATERSLREKLGAAPRRIVGGQVVLEFEHGSFLMATSSGRLRCTPGGAFQNTPASTLLLLAPADDRRLFEQLLPLLHCRTPESSLAQLPVGQAVESMRARDAVFFSRLPDAERAPERFVAANIGLVGGAWQVDATLAPAESWLPGVDRESPRAWSPDLLGTLPPNPALVMIGTRDAVREARLWSMPLVGLPLPDPESAGLGSLLGTRSMFAVWLGAGSGQEPEVLMATDTPNLDRLIGPADGYLSSQGAGSDAERSASVVRPPAPGGPGPSALRSVLLRRDSAAAGIESTLNWLYVPEDCEGAEPGAAVREGVAQPGWWVLHYQPRQSAQAAPSAASASAFADLTPRRYLHIGMAEPRAWGERMAALSAGMDPAGETARLLASPFVLPQIWSIRWAVWYDEGGRRISAEVTLDLTPAAAADAK